MHSTPMSLPNLSSPSKHLFSTPVPPPYRSHNVEAKQNENEEISSTRPTYLPTEKSEFLIPAREIDSEDKQSRIVFTLKDKTERMFVIRSNHSTVPIQTSNDLVNNRRKRKVCTFLIVMLVFLMISALTALSYLTVRSIAFTAAIGCSLVFVFVCNFARIYGYF